MLQLSSHWHDFLSNFNFKFFVHFCWFTSALPATLSTKKLFCGNTKEMKPHSFFVLSLPSQLVHFLSSIFPCSSVFDCKFIWKSYVIFFVYWVHFCSDERYLLTCLITYWMKSWVKKLQISSTFAILREKFAKVDKTYRWFWYL